MVGRGGKVRRKRRSADEWRALLARFAASGASVAAFCQAEAVSVASFRRWRALLGEGPAGERAGGAAAGFVDLGTLAPSGPVGSAPAARLELTLDLGGGVVLHLVRG
jgi:transposase-like protein